MTLYLDPAVRIKVFSGCNTPPGLIEDRACVYSEYVIRENSQYKTERTDNDLFCVIRDSNTDRFFYDNPCPPATDAEFSEFANLSGLFGWKAGAANWSSLDPSIDRVSACLNNADNWLRSGATDNDDKQTDGANTTCPDSKVYLYRVGDPILIGPPLYETAAATTATTAAPDNGSSVSPMVPTVNTSAATSIPTNASAKNETTSEPGSGDGPAPDLPPALGSVVPPRAFGSIRLGQLGLAQPVLGGLCGDFVRAGYMVDAAHSCARIFRPGGDGPGCPAPTAQTGFDIGSYTGFAVLKNANVPEGLAASVEAAYSPATEDADPWIQLECRQITVADRTAGNRTAESCDGLFSLAKADSTGCRNVVVEVAYNVSVTYAGEIAGITVTVVHTIVRATSTTLLGQRHTIEFTQIRPETSIPANSEQLNMYPRLPPQKAYLHSQGNLIDT